jgi:hypothetical protein
VSQLFVPLLALHVVTAVLGLGSVLAVALVAAASRRAGHGLSQVSTVLSPLLRSSGISLGLMLITGILMVVAAGGAFHRFWWLRASVLLLVLTGVLHGFARRSFRRGVEADVGGGRLQQIERLAFVMSVLIATIAVLMELKPF